MSLSSPSQVARPAFAAALLGALSLARTAPAAALPGEAASRKAACVASHDRAQSLSSASRLKAARAELVACSADACPEVVREDCARSLVALDTKTPTIVLGAQVDGRDATDAKVTLDGETMNSAPGRSIVVDPGQHVARFEQAGRTVNVEFVAREGEKNRLVTGQFVSPIPSRSPSPATGGTTPARERSVGRRTPVLPIVFAGTGAVALGGGLYMRLRADSDAADLKGSCAPFCDPSRRDALSDRVVLSNVALGIGAGALVLAAATYLLDRK
jgi:hypothetical protein